MTRNRLAVAAAFAALFALAVGTRPAGAAAEVHHLNLIFSAIPTQIDGGGVNDVIESRNHALENLGLKGLDEIKQGWMFEAQLRYMINSRIALNAGVGQIKKATEQEYLPAIQQAVTGTVIVNGAPLGSFTTAWKRDAPGFYVEGGVHMFFATRFSVLLGVLYRSAKIEALLDRTTHEPALAPDGLPLSMDLSGAGGRMALAFGF